MTCEGIQSIEWEKRNAIFLRHKLLCCPFSPDIALLCDRELGTLTLGQGYPGLDTLTDDENVGYTGSECPVQRILDVNDIESSNMFLSVHDDTSPAHVAPTSDDDDVACVEFHKVGDFALLKIEFHGVVDFDERIGVANGTTVVGDDMRDTATTNGYATDLQELVGGFFGGDTVDGETTLDIVQETEVLSGLFDGDNIHESSREGRVRADLSVNFDQALLDDGGNFFSSQGVL